MAIIDMVGEVVRVTIAWTYPDSQLIENNLSYRCQVAGGADTRLALGVAVQSVFSTNYAPRVGPQASMYGNKVSNLSRLPTPAPATTIAVVAGTGANPNCPTQARPLLKWKTALAGRKYRGRLYLPPPQTSDVTNTGFPSAALNAAIGVMATTLTTPISTGGSTWVLCIAHLVKGSPTLTSYTDIISGQAAGLFGTQRKSGNTGRVNTSPW